MERELRGTWSDAIVDGRRWNGGRMDALILDFTAWLENERLARWQIELRTKRPGTAIRLGPAAAGERLSFDHRLDSQLVVRGSLYCHSLSPDTAVIEAAQLTYGFDERKQTLLGHLVKLQADSIEISSLRL